MIVNNDTKRGNGFESRSGLNVFFSELLFHCLSCVYGKGMLYVHVRNIPSKKKKKKYNDR